MTAAHGWPIAEVASDITVFFVVSALVTALGGCSLFIGSRLRLRAWSL